MDDKPEGYCECSWSQHSDCRRGAECEGLKRMAPRPDEAALSPRQQRAAQELRIRLAKDNALEISLTAIAADLERRQKDGSLTEDLKNMKTGAVLGQLTRIAAAIKQAAVLVMPGNPMPMRDPVALKVQSAVALSDEQRRLRRKAAEATDAEIVEPE